MQPPSIRFRHMLCKQLRVLCSLILHKLYCLNRQLYKIEGGLRPFFKGIQPSLFGTVPHRAISFSSYHRYKDWFGKESCFNTLSAGTFASNTNCFDNAPASSHDVFVLLYVGLTANTFISPPYMVKAKTQLDTQKYEIL